MTRALDRIVWRLAYRMEERRQLHAARGQLLRQAAACIALAALRLWPVGRA